MMQQENIYFMEFQRRFGCEDACRDHLFRKRWPNGLTCPICGGKHFYVIKTRNIFECRCKHQLSLTAGTIMHGSRTPLTKWFWVIYVRTYLKFVDSPHHLKKELNVSYQTAWSMLKKISGEIRLGEASIVNRLFN